MNSPASIQRTDRGSLLASSLRGFVTWEGAQRAIGLWLIEDVMDGQFLEGHLYRGHGVIETAMQRAEIGAMPFKPEWTFGDVYNKGKRVFHSELEAMIENGVGLTTGQGSDPQLMLDVSDDSGRTWRAFPTKDIGQIGQYQQRVVWNALFSVDDPMANSSMFVLPSSTASSAFNRSTTCAS